MAEEVAVGLIGFLVVMGLISLGIKWIMDNVVVAPHVANKGTKQKNDKCCGRKDPCCKTVSQKGSQAKDGGNKDD